MRRVVTISVSDEMYGLIRRGRDRRSCSTVSEYIRLLVRSDHEREDPVPKPEEPEILRTANYWMAAGDDDDEDRGW